ncbi:hypothetical protein P4O66_008423 [Electrophorus voltai]|uniref:Uncharacterized protein n=1 Tax=Electrophorus voltai TaxID=2609070 RepID=A0AAD8ZCS8_9TELE|nr:hypothetical protein P4O66_008423 [Electrophorus voltai]
MPQLLEDLAGDMGNRDLSKDILEMLHISKLSVPHPAKPHPYTKCIYQLLAMQESRQSSDGPVVQSFCSIQGKKLSPTGAKDNTSGWIWFSVSHLRPSITVAELVLLRRSLHPEPLSVMVAVHSLSPGAGNKRMSGLPSDQLLSLNELPPLGYDMFNVMATLKPPRDWLDMLGFQLRFGDKGSSLVLHEALTQSPYCLNGRSVNLHTTGVVSCDGDVSKHHR